MGPLTDGPRHREKNALCILQELPGKLVFTFFVKCKWCDFYNTCYYISTSCTYILHIYVVCAVYMCVYIWKPNAS